MRPMTSEEDIIDEIVHLGLYAGVFRWVLMYADYEELADIKQLIEQELPKYENSMDRKRVAREVIDVVKKGRRNNETKR